MNTTYSVEVPIIFGSHLRYSTNVLITRINDIFLNFCFKFHLIFDSDINRRFNYITVPSDNVGVNYKRIALRIGPILRKLARRNYTI